MLMMSGAIARASDAKQDSAQVFIKGAPFEVAALVGFAALPQGWGAVSISHVPPHLAAAAAPPVQPFECEVKCAEAAAVARTHTLTIKVLQHRHATTVASSITRCDCFHMRLRVDTLCQRSDILHGT